MRVRPAAPWTFTLALPALLPGPLSASSWAWALCLLGIAVLDARLYLGLQREAAHQRWLEQRLDELGDNLPAVIYQARLHADGHLELPFVAGDARQLFGVAAPDLQQAPSRLLAAVLEADRPPLLAAIARSVHGGEPLQATFRARGVHGVRTLVMHAWRSADAMHWNGYWMDDSAACAQRREGESRRHSAQLEAQARDRMLHVLGDGIRSPLDSLQRSVEALQQGPLDTRQREAVDALAQATVMLEQIMDDVLEEPLGDIEVLPLREQPVDLHGLLQQVQRLMLPAATARGLQLQLRVSPQLAGALCVDALRLRQVLLNLLGNALKFTRQGGVVLRLRVLEDDATAQRLRIDVLDSGAGIPLELQHEVFEPYRQGRRGITREFGGTGLGLDICRQLVERMRGRLYLRSRPGRGTRVSVELQVARPARVPLQATTDARVLVADDDPVSRMLLQWWLRDRGLAPAIAVDGQQALQLWRRERFALLLCDEQMPGLSGSALAQCIRAEERTDGHAMRTVIIALSAEPGAIRSPAIDVVLSKPPSETQLHAAVCSLCPQLLVPPVADPVQVATVLPRVDRQALQRRYGSAQRVDELLRVLANSLDEDLPQLRHLAQRGDGPGLARALHRLAGALGSVGLQETAQWLRGLSEEPVLPPQALQEVLVWLQDYREQLADG